METTTFSLLPAQQSAFEQIKAFLDNDSDVFILKGYAGTGKTTLIKYIADYLQDKNLYEILAPTGRAAKILRQKTNSGRTIHSYIYSGDLVCKEKFNEDKSKKNFVFVFPVKAESTTLKTIIIDESSMVSDTETETDFLKFGSGKLLSDLLEYKKNCGVKKLIFIGDPAQLPPVGDSRSYALDDNYFVEKGYKTEVCELTEVVRQKSESKILSEAIKIRQLLQQDKSLRVNYVLEADDNEIVSLDITETIKQYTDLFPVPDINNSIMICYSNKRTCELNVAAREVYFPGQKTVQTGDILLVNTNNHKTGLLNGDMVKVLEVGSIDEHKNIPVTIEKEKRHISLKFRDVKLCYVDSEGPREIDCKIFEDLLYSDNRDLSRWELRALYIDFCMRNSNLKDGTREFKDALRENPFFNALRVKFGYAVTCHKSQGGEWDSVFVDYSDRWGFSDDVLRWCYTATTRAKHKLFAINAPHITAVSKLTFTDITKIGKAPKDFWIQDDNLSTPFHSTDTHISIRLKYLGVEEALKETSFKISNVKSFNYLEKYEFSAENGEKINIDAYYDGSGFFKMLPVNSDNENKNLLCSIFNKTIAQPPEIKYVPSDELMSELRQRMVTAAEDAGVVIVNVVEEKEKFFVNYYLITDARFAVIQFYFKAGHFSTAMPKSELGKDDEKLAQLIKHFENVI